MSSKTSRRISTETKLELASAVVTFVAAFVFYRGGSSNIATALFGTSGGLLLAALFGMARSYDVFGARNQ